MDAPMHLTLVFHFQVNAVVIKVSIPFARRPLLLILALIHTVWGLMPRAVGINGIILVSPGYDTTYSVLAPSMGEPAVESLMSDEATVVADVPEGAVLGDVIGVRKLTLGALDTSWVTGALDFRSFRDV